MNHGTEILPHISLALNPYHHVPNVVIQGRGGDNRCNVHLVCASNRAYSGPDDGPSQQH